MQPNVTSHQKGVLSARPVALTPLSKSNLDRLEAGPKTVRSDAHVSSQLKTAEKPNSHIARLEHDSQPNSL